MMIRMDAFTNDQVRLHRNTERTKGTGQLSRVIGKDVQGHDSPASDD